VAVLSISAFASATSIPVIFALLAGIIVLVAACALAVMRQAEHLARQLGEPYGTLVLTLSIVLIEVVLICAVMLGPGKHATIARDSVMAVAMIIFNLVVGLSLIIGTRRHGALQPNRTAAASYLAVLTALLAASFGIPAFISETGSYSPAQALVVLIATICLYGYFLGLQMDRNRADFQEISRSAVEPKAGDAKVTNGLKVRGVVLNNKQEVTLRAALLVGAAIPIVLASHPMAALLDEGLARTGAPPALSGVLIAGIVFLPETLTALRAAAAGEIQRVSNLCHGALVSTVGLTIPAVLAIGLLTGQLVVLAQTPASLMLLAVTLIVSFASFMAGQIRAIFGGVHLMLFALYIVTVFA